MGKLAEMHKDRIVEIVFEELRKEKLSQWVDLW